MPSQRQQSCWDIYDKEMSPLNHGHALWEPAPLSYFKRIKPGDVGYIRTGCFHLLFSAGLPLGNRRLGIDVPSTFQQLDVGPILNRQPRAPGYLITNNVRADQKAPLTPPASSPSSSSSTTSEPSASRTQISFPMLESGCTISFRLLGGQGAALVTKYQTYKEDVQRMGNFEKYAKQHYASWVVFARETGHGIDLNPVLVTGVDRTRDFAMVSCSGDNDDLKSEFTTSVSEVTPAFAWGTWHTTGLVFTNCGPQLCRPPAQTMDLTSTGGNDTETASDQYNQSVFVRYYAIRKRLGFPKIIKAGAGPRDLDEGGREDEDEESSEVDALSSLAAESDTIIHNTTPDEKDGFDTIAEYIFQNSDACSALIHHRDIARLLQESGGDTELSTALLEGRPAITVDPNGVGTVGPQTYSPEIMQLGGLGDSQQEIQARGQTRPPVDTPPMVLLGATSSSHTKDRWRMALNNQLQANGGAQRLQYVDVPSGPAHKPTWHCTAHVDGVPYARGTGISRDEAREDAARSCYTILFPH